MDLVFYLAGILCTLSTILVNFSAASPLCCNITGKAGGGTPNSGFPTLISENAIKEFQLMLFLENLEASFFATGLANITSWGANGYPNDTVEIIGKVAAQKDVLVTTIRQLLEAYGQVVIPPCNYSFPVATMPQFLALSEIITSVGISAIIGIADRIASTDPLLLKTTSSIVSVEGRHDAFFRHMQGNAPNPAPFDTGISNIWAYNLVLPYVVPGSCPTEVALPILPTLSAVQVSEGPAKNASFNAIQMEFTWDPSQTSFSTEEGKPLFAAWLNQLNLPTYTNLTVSTKGKGVANVPQGLTGATFAAITTQQPNHTNDLGLAALAGPIVLNMA